MPAPQTSLENCVAHNGSLIPIPGRDVMVQAWYQGGVSVFDWTDAAHPKEIAFFDRGPVDSDAARRWAAPGRRTGTTACIVSSEIARGLDILELTPSGWLSQNEIDAAKTVHLDYFNTQSQPRLVWPATLRARRRVPRPARAERRACRRSGSPMARKDRSSDAREESGHGAERCAHRARRPLEARRRAPAIRRR